jgi:hypothetical protein
MYFVAFRQGWPKPAYSNVVIISAIAFTGYYSAVGD